MFLKKVGLKRKVSNESDAVSYSMAKATHEMLTES